MIKIVPLEWKSVQHTYHVLNIAQYTHTFHLFETIDN